MRNKVAHWVIVSVALQLAMVCTLQAGIITDIVESGTGQFGDYAVVASVADGGPGLQEGSPIYVDRSNNFWSGPNDDPMASYLVGLEYVMTRNNDKNVSDLRVDITVGELANVYLFDYSSVSLGVAGATFTTVGPNEIAQLEAGNNKTYYLRKAQVGPNETVSIIGRDGLMYGLAVQPVPEPSGLVLTFLGVAALAVTRRRRRVLRNRSQFLPYGAGDRSARRC